MNFGKIALGALILAIGALFLAVRMGFAHPDTPVFLLRYWPVLLIAFGLAFLAGAIKNPMLGCLAIILILGGTALGVYWMNREVKHGRLAHAPSSIDIGGTNAGSLSVRIRTLMGTFDFRETPRPRTVLIGLRDVAGDSAVGYRFEVTGKRAVLDSPGARGGIGLPPPATRLEIRVPRKIPVSLSWTGWLGSMHADLANLTPAHCAIHEVLAASRIDFDDAGRPEEIRVWGFLSTIRIRIPGDCPVRIVGHSPFILRSFPSDIEEQAQGRGKERVDAALGRGRPVRIDVDGAFVRIKIDRMPLTKVSTQEAFEWRQPAGIASRFHSPSS